MGTLFEQETRLKFNVDKKNVEEFIEDAIEISKKYKIELKDVLEAYKIKEMARYSNLYVINGNIHDEQMAGLGKELSGIKDALSEITV